MTKITLRKKKTQDKYNKYKKTWPEGFCPLCHLVPIRSFDSFILVKNDYPADKIAKQHDMLCLKEHKAYLTDVELIELKYLKENVFYNYDCVVENFKSLRSVEGHWHIHFWIFKDKE